MSLILNFYIKTEELQLGKVALFFFFSGSALKRHGRSAFGKVISMSRIEETSNISLADVRLGSVCRDIIKRVI